MELREGLEVADEATFAKVGKRLGEVELAVLQGCWQGQTYEQIAQYTGYSLSYLNRTVAPKLWQTLSLALGEKVTKKNFRFCLERRRKEKEGERGSVGEGEEVVAVSSAVVPVGSVPVTVDWGEAIDVSVFYGRQRELETLNQWIEGDRCRLVAILGMGGMGKTALSVKLAQGLGSKFEFVIWRSVRNAPSLETLLMELVPFLSGQTETQADAGKLLQCLRQSRCLVVLDNLETLLDAERAGQFRAGFEGYSELLRLAGEVPHQSCMVLTSREKPAEVAILEGIELAVRSLRLDGSPEAAQAIIQGKGLVGTEEQQRGLGDRYSNSPLALKIVATSIQELFDGRIETFLQEDTLIFNGVRRLLEQQFQRLSALERSIMYWLAINREWTSISELTADLVPAVSKGKLLEALEKLSFRSLIETQGDRYTQQPVVMEYIVEQILDTVVDELLQSSLQWLTTHALLKAETKDYLQDTQRRLLLEPLVGRLFAQFHSHEAIACHLQQLLKQQQQTSCPFLDYGAGNLLNLLCFLRIDLTGSDFSGLTLRQVYLRETPLHQVNLSHATLKGAVFAEPLVDINNMALSPDGKLLAMMGLDGTLFFYEMATGQRLFALVAHQNWSFGIAFAPDGRTFFTSSFDQTLKQWDLATRQCLQVWQTDSPVWQLALSVDGVWLASAHENGTVLLRNLQTDSEAIALSDREGTVRDLAFHPHRNLLASTSGDRTVKLWDAETGECVLALCEHTGDLWAVRFHPQGNTLVSVCADRTIHLWDITTGECLRRFAIDTDNINYVAFSPDGQILACACQDSTIRLWDIQRDRIVRVLQGHRMGVWGVLFSPDGQILMSSSGSAQIKFWEVRSGQCLRTLQGEKLGFWAIAFNPQGTHFVSGGDDARLRLWSVATQECLQIAAGHKTRIVSVAFHPQQALVASSSYDCLVKVWDLQGRCLQTFTGHESWVVDVAFHPHRPLLLSCAYDSTLRLWSLETGRAVCAIALPEAAGFPYGIAVRPQGDLFASGSEDGQVRLWDIESGSLLQTFSGHAARIWKLTFHPQGQLLASGGHDCTVKLWDIQSGQCLSTWAGFAGGVMCLGFSPDGCLLAVSSDRTIQVWDITTGQRLSTLSGHTNVVNAVAFQPKPAVHRYVLASASYDETIRFWNAETGECLHILRADRFYEGTNITGVTGLGEGQKAVLRQLGAIELG